LHEVQKQNVKIMKETVLYATFIFLYEQKSNVHHSIEVFLKISTKKLQEQIQSDFYQITFKMVIICLGATQWKLSKWLKSY
jgi:hypothetical protein